VPEAGAIHTIPQGTVVKTGQELSTSLVVQQASPSLVSIGAYLRIGQIQSLASSPHCATGQRRCAAQATTKQTI
jgi:hypothetical protein